MLGGERHASRPPEERPRHCTAEKQHEWDAESERLRAQAPHLLPVCALVHEHAPALGRGLTLYSVEVRVPSDRERLRRKLHRRDEHERPELQQQTGRLLAPPAPPKAEPPGAPEHADFMAARVEPAAFVRFVGAALAGNFSLLEGEYARVVLGAGERRGER